VSVPPPVDQAQALGAVDQHLGWDQLAQSTAQRCVRSIEELPNREMSPSTICTERPWFSSKRDFQVKYVPDACHSAAGSVTVRRADFQKAMRRPRGSEHQAMTMIRSHTVIDLARLRVTKRLSVPIIFG